MSFAVGIDLGTTNSVVAHLVDGCPAVVSGPNGDALLPSVVGFDPHGNLLVGRPARNQFVVAPERTVRSVKRSMGSEKSFPMAGRSWTPPELSALVLRALTDQVVAATGHRPDTAVITVPAWFTEPQRQATHEAGRIAGLEVLRLVNEPTAAALTYDGTLDERMLVYDLGGGTFDVSVVERGADFTEVLASRGDTKLGGDDLDLALARWLAARWGHPDLETNPVAMARLLAAAERAKIALSTRTTVRVQESFLFNGAHLDLLLTRAELEEVALPLILPTIQHVEAALSDSRTSIGEISRVLLVGGMTSMPVVHQLIRDRLALPVHHEVDPDTSVALGAAILAGRLTGQAVAAMLVDVTPQSLAIASRNRDDESNPFASIIIERNTVVPVTRSREFQVSATGRSQMGIRVGQGEAEWFNELTELGNFVVDKISGAVEGDPVDVSMHLDVSGKLTVSATIRKTGKEGKLTISSAAGALLEHRRAGSIVALAQTKDGAGLAEAFAAAERLLAQARTIEGGSAEARQRLEQAIAALDAACAAEDAPAIHAATDTLADVILDLI